MFLIRNKQGSRHPLKFPIRQGLSAPPGQVAKKDMSPCDQERYRRWVSPANAWFVCSIAPLYAIQTPEQRSSRLRNYISAVHPVHTQIFNALNSLDLKSLEEPRYLLGEFVKQPLACLTLGEPTTQSRYERMICGNDF
jgi:hypothetical protein